VPVKTVRAVLAALALTAVTGLMVAPPALALPRATVAENDPVAVAVVVPFTVVPGTDGLIDTTTLAAYTAPGGLLTRELDAVAGTSATIGLDPMIVASIRLLGSAAPASALEWLDRLQSVPNEVFLLAYADADPAAAALAGLTDLTPLDFGFAVDPAAFGPAVTPAPTPTDGATATPSPDPTAAVPPDDTSPPPLPTTEDLLAWQTTLPSVAWPADGTVTADGLAALTSAGYDDVLLSAGNVSPASQAVVAFDGIDAVVADDTLTSLVRSATFASTPLVLTDALAQLTTALGAAAAVSPGRTLVATLDRHWPLGTAHLPQVMAAIDAAARTQSVPLSTVLAGATSQAQLAEPTADARADRRAQLVSGASDVDSFSQIAADPFVITAPQRLSLLALLSVGWTTSGDWDTPATDFLGRVRDVLDAVRIVRGSDVLLLSDRSELPITVTNALPVAVTVLVDVRPLRPVLTVEGGPVELTIEANSSNKAKVPVKSIINGEVNVRVTLTDASGVELGTPRFVKVLVRAEWETTGTLIVAVLVVLVFGGGLIRNIVKRRRSARDAAGEKSTEPSPTADD
jgi:hypothetical protein